MMFSHLHLPSSVQHVASAPASSTTLPSFECRICHEEEVDSSHLETPCACSGTLQYAHRKCIQRWCYEKGDTICEVCQQPYQHGYIAPQSQHQPENISIDIGDWEIMDVNPFQHHNPSILALRAAERHLLESDYEENAALSSSVFCCRSVAIILMILLLFRHGIALALTEEEDDSSLILMIFILRLVGFFLPCYIIIHAISMLQQGQQEIDAVRTGELSLLIHRGRRQGIHVLFSPFDLP